MYQFSLKGSVCGEAPKLIITFLNALKRKLCSHGSHKPTSSLNFILALRDKKLGFCPSRRASISPPSDQGPHHGCGQHVPRWPQPAGWLGRGGQPGVAATVGRIPSTCDGATPQTDRSGQFTRLRPPPTHSSCAADPPSGGPGKVGDETSKGRKQNKQRRAIRRQPIYRRGCSGWQKCRSPAGKCFDLLTLHFSLKEIKSTFSTFKNDYFNVPEINHNRKYYGKNI